MIRHLSKIKAALAIVMAALLLLAAGCNSGMPSFVDVGPNGSRTDDEVGFQFDPPAKGEEYVLMKTSKGDIKIRLFKKSAPIAVENFRLLVQQGYYDGLKFHRIIPDFMIQGGDPTGTGSGGESAWKKNFGYEFNKNLLHFRGALSMAHSSLPNSNGSQFFIVQNSKIEETVLEQLKSISVFEEKAVELYKQHGGTPHLDGIYNPDGHTVFGQVFEGMDIVDAIAAVGSASGTPSEEVKITKATLEKYEG